MLGNKNVFVYPNCVIVYEDKVHEDLNPIEITKMITYYMNISESVIFKGFSQNSSFNGLHLVYNT